MKTLKVTYNTVSPNAQSGFGPAVFLCKFDNVKVGDTVVIPGKSYYYAATIVDITDGYAHDAKHHIVSLVDDSEYKQNVVNEAKRRAIVKALEAMDKKRRDEDRFAYLGALDADAAKMLEELKTLG